MNPLIQLKTTPRLLITLTLLFVCFGLLPNAQAVVPAPDGGYPNFTTAEGTKALQSLTTGAANTAVGWLSLFSNAAGSFNTATGAGSLLFNTADANTAFGAAALLFNTTGTNNTAVGATALLHNTIGLNNTAIGDQALFSNTTSGGNTAIGANALANNNTGNGNTAVGWFALSSSTTGGSNIALGIGAGSALTTGDENIDIGNLGVAGESDTIRIGDSMIHTATFIAGINGATASGGTAVFINANGQLGTMTSSKRFKDDIKPMKRASEVLYGLEPVTFRYKKEIDPAGASQFGLVAEDVEKVNPDLVVRDKEGKPYSVRYDQVNAMLLNEFIKEHKAFIEEQRKVEVQEKTIAQLKSGMTALAATVKQQASQIQKVSTQLEASKPAPQVVNNP